MAVTISILFTLILACGCLANIHEKLRYFETLKVSDFNHRLRRSTYDPDPNSDSHITEVKVETLGRHFHLFLKTSHILSPGFKADIIRGNGRTEKLVIDRGSLLTGHLADDTSAIANVNYEKDGTILANIVTKYDTYIIEPSWRLLPGSDNHTMVSYRRSDVKFEDPDNGKHVHRACGIKEGDDPELHGRVSVEQQDDHHRSRRASIYLAERTTCKLMVVADYRFFDKMGGKSASATALYLINVIQFVNTIYRKTQFDEGGDGMIGIGFEIGEMRIHNESTPVSETLQGRTHYNVFTDYWDTKDLLESFSMDRYFDRFCLAHLFTYTQFKDGVLGLAYIASERHNAVGGICSPLYPKYTGTRMTLNTGWSSSQNAAGHRVLALQAQLVTSHEFGHNWGSEHDPETDNCAPSEYKDGKYIMYPWAVSGYDKNNQIFSPCSRAYIFKVIKKKGYNCFIEGKGDGVFCGNGRIDKGEACDAGWNTKNDLDPCCNDNCQLRKGMKCSPMNFGCCNETCQPAYQGKVCRPALEGSCHGEIQCNGVDITCPDIIKYANNSLPCIDEGTCMNGECLNLCQMFDVNLTPCQCAEDTGKACYRCCKPAHTAGTCASINNTLLPDGRPCYQGLCNQGVCEKKQRDMVQRLFNIIEDISIDQLVEFMRSNIVGTVIVLSLLIWIPASCTITILDRKTSRKEKDKRNWMSRSNRTLFGEEDSGRIRRIPTTRTPRTVSAMRRETGEPTVRWPEGDWANHPAPQPVKPIKFPISETHGNGPDFDDAGFDIGPDGAVGGPDHETVV